MGLLTAAENRELDEVRTEIAQIEHRLGTSHAAGDTGNIQGQSHTFQDNQKWRRRLSLLRARRNQLEALDAGQRTAPRTDIILGRVVNR